MNFSSIIAALVATIAACAFTTAGQAQTTPHAEIPEPTLGFQPGLIMNEVRAGDIYVDEPTLENLGFRWYIEGDSNRNARVDVAFRKTGENEWRDALPMLRSHHEIVHLHRPPSYRIGNLFAGSILFLEPATEYEVRFTMIDPDGGAPPPTVTRVTTRPEPQLYADGRKLHVYPDSFTGTRAPGSFASVMEAYAQAQPGDILVLHAGVYQGGPYILTRSGLPGRPIGFVGEGEVVFEGPAHDTDLFRIDADHLYFENIGFRRARTAIRTGTGDSIGDKGSRGASWLTVRHCRIDDVVYGIWTLSENSSNWYIADNVITGFDETWFPRPAPGYMDGSHTGVNVYGRGHVVCHNRISRFSDSLAIANYHPPVEDIRLHPVNIDFYNNDLSFATDDTIETDYGMHNIRVYRNRLYNAHTALSVQPAFGGPIYLIRNVAFGITSLPYKFNMMPAGIEAYHNTTLSARRAFDPASGWQNTHLRNNLILGGTGRAMGPTGSWNEHSSLDFNGWFGRMEESSLFRFEHLNMERVSYATLEEFTRATGQEKNGMMVDYSIFEKAAPPTEGHTYAPGDVDLRLRADSRPIDAGLRLPNINDDHTGAAPDLGAYERDRPLPHYGPRPR